MKNRERVEELEKKLIVLKKKLDAKDVTDIELRTILREFLSEIEIVLENQTSIFSLDSTKGLKKTLLTIEEAFLYSSYADNLKERTSALLLFKNLSGIL